MRVRPAGQRRPARLLRLALVGVTSVAALGACSQDTSNLGTKGSDIGDLDGFTPPALLDLKIQKEDIGGTLEKAERAYVDATVLYSLRSEDDLVQATLQISRFTEDADVGSSTFRNRVVQRLGGAAPQRLRLGEETVFLNSSVGQRVTAWFRGRHLLVLSVREDYEQPRNLLRAALEVQP